MLGSFLKEHINHLDLIKLQRKRLFQWSPRPLSYPEVTPARRGLVYTLVLSGLEELYLLKFSDNWYAFFLLKRAFAWAPAFHMLCVPMDLMTGPTTKQPGEHAKDPFISEGLLSLSIRKPTASSLPSG